MKKAEFSRTQDTEFRRRRLIAIKGSQGTRLTCWIFLKHFPGPVLESSLNPQYGTPTHSLQFSAGLFSLLATSQNIFFSLPKKGGERIPPWGEDHRIVSAILDIS